MKSNVMSDRLEAHFGPEKKTISVRQTRRGWCQELLGCEALDEFKWFDTTDNKNELFGTSLEESNCCMRICCPNCHSFNMTLKEQGTGSEILSMHRPQICCPACPCKCCCFQQMTLSSNGQKLGKIEEKFYCCVPRMVISRGDGVPVYKVHPPTCIGGMCMNCCTEGNPCCGRGCCRVAFHIFPADQSDTDNGAPYVGKIVKVPKSFFTEVFTDSEAYDVTFPADASSEQKALIAGSTVFINASYFEDNNAE